MKEFLGFSQTYGYSGYNKRHEIRLEKSDPLLDEFQEYIKREIKNALPKSALAH